MSISVYDRYLTSKQVDERIDDLEYEINELTDIEEEIESHEDYFDFDDVDCDDDDYDEAYEDAKAVDLAKLEARRDDLREELASEIEELKMWEDMRDDNCGIAWCGGITFIHEDAFEDYIREECRESGCFGDDFPWWIAVDWEATADNRKSDYSVTEVGGETYYHV